MFHPQASLLTDDPLRRAFLLRPSLNVPPSGLNTASGISSSGRKVISCRVIVDSVVLCPYRRVLMIGVDTLINEEYLRILVVE